MTGKQKKEYALTLFLQEVSQEEIAVRVGSTPQTICRWRKAHNWDSLKKSLLTTKREELANLYNQVSELNAAIKNRPEGQRYAAGSEADTLSKLTTSIRKLETDTSVADTIDVFMKHNEFIRKAAPDKLKVIIELQDAFIKSLL